MSYVDWEIVGIWSQVAAIVITGMAATLVAWFQLRTLARNEQTRATVEYVTAYDTVQKQIPGAGSKTVAICMTRINDLLRDSKLFNRYVAFAAVFRNTREAVETIDPFPPYQEFSNAAITVANYFILAAKLIEDKRLDPKLFIGSLGDTIIRVAELAEKLVTIEPYAKELLGDPAVVAMFQMATQAGKPKRSSSLTDALT